MAHKVDYELYEKVKTLGDDWNSPTVEVHHYKTFPLENTDDLQVLEINGATKIEAKHSTVKFHIKLICPQPITDNTEFNNSTLPTIDIYGNDSQSTIKLNANDDQMKVLNNKSDNPSSLEKNF